MHGTISHSSCLRCGASYPLADVRARQAVDPQGIPRCECGEPLKPDVVLFGEYLPVDALGRAEQLARGAELMLCIGSSLEVYPVAQLPAATLANGGRIAILTQGETPYDSRATVRMAGDIVDELDAVLVALELRPNGVQALATARARSAASIRSSVNLTVSRCSSPSGPASAACAAAPTPSR